MGVNKGNMEILLVIDMQEKYMKDYDAALLARVNQRILEANATGIPVVYVRNIGRVENADKYVFCNNLAMVSELIFEKRIPSAFSSQDFTDYLKKSGVDLISIIGVDGRCCVFKTAMDAVNAGYKVRLYLESVAARNDNFFTKELPQMKEAGVMIVV